MPKYKHGSGSVYKRGKTWWITYYHNGKQVWESAKTKDKAEARRVLQARLGQIAEGRYRGPALERVTFDDLAVDLLTDYEVQGRKSLYWVRIKVEKHLARFFGGKKARNIATPDINHFISVRQTEGASNAEINRELAALKRMFNLGIQAEKIEKKPHIPRLPENNVRRGFFEPWQFDALLPKLPDYLRPVATFSYYSGWRAQSELLCLKWDQVDLESGAVRLYRGTTKNNDGRLIKLPAVLRQVLEQQWHEHLTAHPECEWVFHKNGARLFSFYKAWRRACREAGLSGKLCHDFRRTAVRNLVRAGVPERVAMTITGHKTRDVFDRYNIVSDTDLDEAARLIDQRIASRTMTKTMTADIVGPHEDPVSH